MGMLNDVIAGLRNIHVFLKGSELYDTDWIEIPGIAAADALDANDTIGTVFNVAVPPKGRILSAKLIDPDDDTLALTAHLYTDTIVAAASDAAYTIANTYAQRWAGNVTFPAGTDEGAFKAMDALDVNIEYNAPDGKLRIICSTTGTPNIAAGAMPKIRFFILPL